MQKPTPCELWLRDSEYINHDGAGFVRSIGWVPPMVPFYPFGSVAFDGDGNLVVRNNYNQCIQATSSTCAASAAVNRGSANSNNSPA